MLATNHALSGALIGALLPLPVAIPAAFASHFVLDALPHYGIPALQRNESRVYKLIVFSDTFIGLVIAATVAILGKWPMEITGWVAYSPDALWVLYYFKNGRTLHIQSNNWFTRFHHRIQRFERPWGIVPDLAFVAIMLPLFIAQVLK